jgi:hypothetical protein
LRISRRRVEIRIAANPSSWPELTGDSNPVTLAALAIESNAEEKPMSKAPRVASLLPLALALACASSLGPAHRSPVHFAETPSPHGAELFPNWPAPPDQVYELLSTGTPEIRETHGAGGGTTGAMKFTLYFPEADVQMDVKWKDVPRDLDGFNNSPRKELAAYAIQRIFLTPEDYVVPTTVVRCARLETYHKRVGRASPTIKGTTCVLGTLSVWMQDVTVPDVLYDEQRFLSDPQYAYFMSNLNLFTYLVDHRDGRSGNFLVSKDDSRRQVFAVDNGISFGPWVFNYFVPNWTKLRVPAVRKEAIDRLRAIHREDLDFLAVVAQLEIDDEGVLRTAPPGAPLDPDDGAVARDGTVQFGLTTSEIDDVYERIQALIRAVDEGRVPVF